jgi:hypothetical protein
VPNLKSQVLDADFPQVRRWPTYLGITSLLVLIVVVLAGGIIWYNSKKASSLAMAAAQQLMQETEGKITERIKLLYDPMFAMGIIYLTPSVRRRIFS